MRHTATADDVVRALEEVATADAAADRAVEDALGIGPNDVKVLRHLLDCDITGHPCTPREISEILGVSSAAVTALLDRLAGAGWISRERHPSDRRSVIVRATVPPGSSARRLLAVHRVSVASAAARLSASERRTVVDFLDDLHRSEEHYLDEARDDAGADARARR